MVVFYFVHTFLSKIHALHGLILLCSSCLCSHSLAGGGSICLLCVCV